VDELCATLMQEFEIDAERCRREVLEFLNDLVKRGLARIVDAKGEG
jgi:Coenzyme PQQ synthesis protein D (PqqD)